MTASNAQLISPGTRIGSNLTVLDTVDGGGKEPVYIVWHHGAWCPMACKVFRTHDRALQEAAVLSALAHPYIVRLLGLEEPGLLLMEFVEGPTLASFIDSARGRRLGVSDAIRVAIHLGSSLQYIHARGFVHLDVKPANVILAGGARPILFDFGSARRIGEDRPTNVTGTDLYIAPEECGLGEVTPAADVFSLGVSLYEMLTGEFPFGDGAPSEPFPQVSANVISARRRRPTLPAALDAVLLSCLSREPDRRPNLPDLILSLHDFISVGPKMWPDDFSPASSDDDEASGPSHQTTSVTDGHVRSCAA
jgi:serine/threonine protein kinase